jgi:DNA-binding transcriptional LysR family regulator
MAEPFRIQQVRQFLIAAESGSFRAAAAGTFRSSAAVSTAMHDLEMQVGAALFEKGQRARLTPLGQTLVPLFSELLQTHDRILTEVRQLARAERGRLSVAVVPFLGEEWFPTLLHRFLDDHPDVDVRVTDERSFQVHGLVADGKVDIGIAARLSDDPKLVFQPVAIDTFGIACRADDPLARNQRPIPWSALADRRLIGNDGFPTLAGHGVGEWLTKTVVWVTSRVSMLDCIRQGIGISVLPRLTLLPMAKDIAFVPLTGPKVTRMIGIITRRGQTLLPAARDMLALIEKELRAYALSHGATLTDTQTESPAGSKTVRLRKKAQ